MKHSQYQPKTLVMDTRVFHLHEQRCSIIFTIPSNNNRHSSQHSRVISGECHSRDLVFTCINDRSTGRGNWNVYRKENRKCHLKGNESGAVSSRTFSRKILRRHVAAINRKLAGSSGVWPTGTDIVMLMGVGENIWQMDGTSIHRWHVSPAKPRHLTLLSKWNWPS